MKLLFTGRGGAGSWTVRGEQLGKACGAKVQTLATCEQMQTADLVVVVKRVPSGLLHNLRKSKAKWVLDVVDFYPQPECGLWKREEAVRWVREQVRAFDPAAVIWPTERMMEDCSDGRPGLVLPHHHRPGIASNPVREKITTVGYEGRELYLGGWSALLQRECYRRGWRFVTNPQHLADLDVVIAVRGDLWDSYAARHWKSNVKLANAHGSGTPFVGNPECGYMETGSGCEVWVEDAHQLGSAFDRLEDQGAREEISDRFRARAYPVDRAASSLLRFLHAL